MSGLTTHVLDLSHGHPASDVAVRLSSRSAPGSGWELLIATRTDHDGRARLRDGDALRPGSYRLEFDIGAYFRGTGATSADPAFLETVTIDFHVIDAGAHHHVPLLASPFGYSTYRGS